MAIHESVPAGGGGLAMRKSLPSPSTGTARTSTTMSGNKKHKRAASATPRDDAPREALTLAQSMVAASHRSMYAFRHERLDGDAVAIIV